MFLLHSLQSPINVGMILRTAEVYEQPVVVLDTHGVMLGERLKTVADFACGALGRHPPAVETSLKRCLERVTGRMILTGFDGNAVPLSEMKWKPGDCVAFGNEYDGLDLSGMDKAQATVWIQTTDQHLPKPRSINPIDPTRVEEVRRNGGATLNVAAAAAIIGYSMFSARTLHLTGSASQIP
ncbi:MAG: TrmH family RNA methyltransferase [Pseudomonadota bacterium]